MPRKRTEKLGESSSHKVLNLITTLDPEDRNTNCRVVSNIKYLLSISKDVNEALSLYFSFLCISLRDIKPEILKSVRQSGYLVVDTPWDASKWAEKLREEGPPLLTNREIVLVVGQLLFIPFRDWVHVDYHQFMSKRTSALSSKLGTFASFGLPMVAQTAIKLGAILDHLRDFKIVIVDDVLTGKYYTRMCVMDTMVSYVGSILSWTYMGTFTMIRDELVKTSSVLLGMEELVPEWEKFNLVVMAVTECQYPQYFGIVAETQELKTLRKSNFPTLAGVAQLSARSKTDPNTEIVRLGNQLGPDIERYYSMHRRASLIPRDRMLACLADIVPKRISETTWKEVQFAKTILSCEEPVRSILIEEERKEQGNSEGASRRKRQRCTSDAGEELNKVAPGVRKLAALTKMIPQYVSVTSLQEKEDAEFIRGLEKPVRDIVYQIRGTRQRPA